MTQGGAITSSMYWNEIYAQIVLALPVSASFFLRKSVDIVALVFVGLVQRGADHDLSAAGLASVTANVTGNSMLFGLAGALSTLCSQAHGNRDKEGLCLALQRALLILPLFVCLPVTLLWYFTSIPVIMAFGQTLELASDVRSYLLCLAPGMWALAGSVSLQNFLHSQEYVAFISVVTLLVALLHPLLCYLLVFQTNMGFFGAALAVSCSKIAELLLLAVYLTCFSDILQHNNFQWSAKCLQGWGPFLALGGPNLLMMSEWWASELIILLSGTLSNPEAEVAALSIYQSINAICFMLPSGFSIAGATRVGNALGANDAKAAQLSSVVAPSLAFCISIVAAVVLLVFRGSLGRLFTDDVEVLYILSFVLLILALYVLADGTQSALTGILKGMGRQSVGAPVVLFSYYVVGMPVSLSLGFEWGAGLGAVGLCIGTAVGTWTHMLLYVLVILGTEWSAEADNAQVRLLERRCIDAQDSDGADWWMLDSATSSMAYSHTSNNNSSGNSLRLSWTRRVLASIGVGSPPSSDILAGDEVRYSLVSSAEESTI